MEQLITFLLVIGGLLGVTTLTFMLLSPPKKKKYTAPGPMTRIPPIETRKAPETLVKPQPGVPMQSKATNAAMAAAYIHTEIMERTTPSYEAPVDNYRCGGGDSPSSDNSGSGCSSGGGGDD